MRPMNPLGDTGSYHVWSIWPPMYYVFVENISEWKWKDDSTDALISYDRLYSCLCKTQTPLGSFWPIRLLGFAVSSVSSSASCAVSLNNNSIRSAMIKICTISFYCMKMQIKDNIPKYQYKSFFLLPADYWLMADPELRQTNQPSTTGCLLGDPGFSIFRSTACQYWTFLSMKLVMFCLYYQIRSRLWNVLFLLHQLWTTILKWWRMWMQM